MGARSEPCHAVEREVLIGTGRGRERARVVETTASLVTAEMTDTRRFRPERPAVRRDTHLSLVQEKWADDDESPELSKRASFCGGRIAHPKRPSRNADFVRSSLPRAG